MSNHAPMPPRSATPCRHCGGRSYLFVQNVTVEFLYRSGTSGTPPRHTLFVCEGCGSMDWFTSPLEFAAHFERLGAKVERLRFPGA